MLQWNGLHAYNAVHVVRVPQSLDLPRLSHVIDGEMEATCLTRLSIDNQRGVFEYRGGPVRNELEEGWRVLRTYTPSSEEMGDAGEHLFRGPRRDEPFQILRDPGRRCFLPGARLFSCRGRGRVHRPSPEPFCEQIPGPRARLLLSLNV